MMISPPILLAAFAFIANEEGSRQHQWHPPRRQTTSTPRRRAYLAGGRVLRASSPSSSSSSKNDDLPGGGGPPSPARRHRRPIMTMASSSSPSVERADGIVGGVAVSDGGGSPAPSSSTFESNGAGGASRSSSSAARATKTAEVTRIPAGRKNGIIVDNSHGIFDDGGGDDVVRDLDSARSNNVRGLLPPWDDSLDLPSRVHCTLTLLAKHLPGLLDPLPALAASTAGWMYAPDVTVTGPPGRGGAAAGGGGETFAEGIDEVLLLSRALAAAATAARQAGSLLDLMAIGTSSSSPATAGGAVGRVECELLIDPGDPLRVMVLWRARLPSILSAAASRFGGGNQATAEDRPMSSSSSSYTEFAGKSTATLSRESGLVTDLRINEVRINGVVIVDTLGTALAAVRKAALAAQSIGEGIAGGGGGGGKRRSSGNPLLDGILNGIQDVVDAVEALPSSEERDGSSDSNIYVVPTGFWDKASFPIEGLAFNAPLGSTDDESINTNSTSFIPVPIDQYRAMNGRTPVAGSKAFVEYAMMHRTLRSFATHGLYKLAGTSSTESEEVADYGISSESIRSLFTTDAELVTFVSASGSFEGRDYITLLRGAGKVADLYRSLALFRESTGGDWKIVSSTADLERQRLLVSWMTESPLKIEGTDSFVFEPPTLSSPSRLPLSSDGDKVEVARRCSSYFNDESDYSPLRIRRIENRQLIVAGVATDSVWAQSFVSAALRSGLAENAPLPDATIIELLRSLTQKKTSTKKASTDSSFPSLDDSAAASFYGILRALHNDIPNIANVGSSSTPAGEFLADTVEMRGLLDEVLVRGHQNYRRLLSIATSSLRAGIQTNTLRLAAKPRTTVEVTSNGSIRVNLILALWVAPQLPLGGGMGHAQAGSQGFGAPLKIEVSSEYIIDSEGNIREHIILESRLNGVLTPGDLFSRWIKGLTREEDNRSKIAPSPLDSLVDVIAWVRSMQERKK